MESKETHDWITYISKKSEELKEQMLNPKPIDNTYHSKLSVEKEKQLMHLKLSDIKRADTTVGDRWRQLWVEESYYHQLYVLFQQELKRKEQEFKQYQEALQKVMERKEQEMKMKKEAQRKLMEEQIKEQTRILAVEEHEKNSLFLSFKEKMKGFTTDEENEALLAKYMLNRNSIRRYFKGNTLLALQVVNRFANENKIRVEDAETVISEFAN